MVATFTSYAPGLVEHGEMPVQLLGKQGFRIHNDALGRWTALAKPQYPHPMQ
jgi:hypothetical protein